MRILTCNEVDTSGGSSDNVAPHPRVVGKNDFSERWPRLGHSMCLPFWRLEKRTDRTTRRGMFVRGLILSKRLDFLLD